MNNRDIKFRVWDTQTKKMLTGFHLFGETTLCGGIHAWQAEQSAIKRDSLEALDDLIIMRYTGVSIPKGGLASLEVDGYDDLYEGDVVYLAGYGNYVCKFPFLQLYESLHQGDVCDKLGNIYENPELNESN